MSTSPSPLTAAQAAAEADAVAGAVLRCSGVAGLHAGGLRQIATYLPGRRVVGVRVDDETVEVAVVAAFGVPVEVLAGQVRAALVPLARGRPVDVYVADVQAPEDPVSSPQPVALPPADA